MRFHKMHGAGNDFVLLDLRDQAFRVDRHSAVALADRRTGIGCDQLLVLRTPANPGCIVEFEVWNADGSRAEQCGNGVRCIGLYLDMQGEAPTGVFDIRGPVATIQVECLPGDHVRVNMGKPEFDPAAIPVTAARVDGHYELEAEGRSYRVGAVSMGNPHAMLLVDDVSAVAVEETGRAISGHPAFPNGCNVGFAQVMDAETLVLRVFERGAGETRACGSGACAAVAILRKNDTVGHKVLVNQAGGDLIIEWPGKNATLTMTGPACHVFEGILK